MIQGRGEQRAGGRLGEENLHFRFEPGKGAKAAVKYSSTDKTSRDKMCEPKKTRPSINDYSRSFVIRVFSTAQTFRYFDGRIDREIDR